MTDYLKLYSKPVTHIVVLAQGFDCFVLNRNTTGQYFKDLHVYGSYSESELMAIAKLTAKGYDIPVVSLGLLEHGVLNNSIEPFSRETAAIELAVKR